MKVMAIVLNVRNQEVLHYILSIDGLAGWFDRFKKVHRQRLLELVKEELRREHEIPWIDEDRRADDQEFVLSHVTALPDWIVTPNS